MYINEALRIAEYTDSSSTGSVNNYALSSRYNILLTNSGLTAITGIAAEKDGQIVYLKTSSVPITLVHNSTSSTSGNRIYTPSATDYNMPANSVACLIYDATTAVWLLQNAASSGATGLNGQPIRNYYSASSDASTVPQVSGTGLNTGYATYTRTDPTLFACTASSTFARTASTSLRGSYVYTVTGASASSSGATKIQFPLFTLDGMDLGKAVRVSFDVTSSLVDGDWDVYIERFDSSNVWQAAIAINGGTGVSGCSNTPSAKIPSGTSTFTGFFVTNSTATDKYALTFRRVAGSSGSISVDTVYVGPQTTTPGNAVTDWISFTTSVVPTSNTDRSSEFSQLTGKYRRIGDSAEVELYIARTAGAATADGTPVGFTVPFNIDISKLNTSGTNVGRFRANFQRTTNTSQPNYDLNMQVVQGTNRVIVDAQMNVSAYNYNNTNFAANEQFKIWFTVPVVGWSSNITVADRAVEEYAFNTSTSTTVSDTTSFGYGSQGALIQNITAGLSRRVRFTTPIQATDTILVEVSTNRTNWFPLTQVFSDETTFAIIPYQTQNAVTVGLGRARIVNSTDVDIKFGQYSNMDGVAYGGAGSGWSSAGACYWRVRKIAGGSLAGFPVGSRNIVGDITGTAVPTGYLGEQLVSRQSSLTSVGTTATYADILTLALTPGTWDLSASITLNLNGATMTAWDAFIGGTASGNNTTGRVLGDNTIEGLVPTSAVNSGGSVASYRINVTSAATYYMKLQAVYSAGTPRYAGRFSATRV